MRFNDRDSGEEGGKVSRDDLVEPCEVLLLRIRILLFQNTSVFDADQAGQGLGYLDAGELVTSLWPSDDDRQVKAEVGDVRERMTAVKQQWREDGKNNLLEIKVRGYALNIAQPVVIVNVHTGCIQRGLYLITIQEMRLCIQFERTFADQLKLLARGQAVRRQVRVTAPFQFFDA